MDQSLNIAYYLEDLNRLQEVDKANLDALTIKYPASANLHFLRAKKYQLEGLVDDIEVFHNASFYITDHHCLYQRMLHSEVEMVTKKSQDAEPLDHIIEERKNVEQRQGQDSMHQERSKTAEEEQTTFEKELLSSIAKLNLAEEESTDIDDSIEMDVPDLVVDETKLKIPKAINQTEVSELNEINALKRENSHIESQDGEKLAEDLSPFSIWLLSLKQPIVAIHRDENSSPDVISPSTKDKNDASKKEKKREKRKKKKKKRQIELEARAKRSVELSEDLATEALAELLASQGHFKEAKKMFQKLSLIFPKKSSYFAVRIQSLKKKKNDH